MRRASSYSPPCRSILMRYKSAAILSAAALAATLTVAGATSASAAAPVDNLRITQVGYNANGADTWFNRNKEYVDVLAEADVDVKGLTVSDSWAKSHADDNPKKCNTFTITSLPGVAE